MSNLPLFSIIIATRNRRRFLERAIRSINNQTYNNLEIVLIDNVSDHPLTQSDINSKFPVKIIRNESSLAASANRNIGIENSTGEFISFLDDDDEIMPTKYASHANAFNSDPTIDLVYGNTKQVGPDGSTIVVSKGPPDITHFLLWRYVHLNAVSIKKEVFDDIKFNENMSSFGDVEIVGRILRRFKAKHIDELHAVWYRDDRSDQITKKNYRRSYENWSVLCDEFSEEINQSKELRRFYHRKMFKLSLMFFDIPRAVRSALRSV